MNSAKRLFVFIFVAAVVSGCGMLSPIYGPAPSPTPIYAPPVPGDTNPPVIISYVTNPSPVIGYSVSSNAASGLQIAQTVSPLLPPPANGIAVAVIGLIAAGLGAFAKVKTSQLNSTKTKLGTAETLLNVTIAGVEAAGDAATKQSIKATSQAAGVAGELESKVNP